MRHYTWRKPRQKAKTRRRRPGLFQVCRPTPNDRGVLCRSTCPWRPQPPKTGWPRSGKGVGTHKWYHRIYASLFGIIETNAYLAFNYFRSQQQEVSHTEFTRKLAMQLITGVDASTQLPLARSRPDPGRRRTSRDSDVDEEDDDDNRDHQLASLFSLTGKPHAQRKCVVCKPTQRKASYYCKSCGPRFVLCGPTTGRLCYQKHVKEKNTL